MAKRKLTFIRKRLRKVERTSKSNIVRKEAQFARALINEPRAVDRISDPHTFKKPLLDSPGQLKKKRIRPFVVVGLGATATIINLKRK